MLGDLKDVDPPADLVTVMKISGPRCGRQVEPVQFSRQSDGEKGAGSVMSGGAVLIVLKILVPTQERRNRRRSARAALPVAADRRRRRR
jgi:hypothetical protein